VLTVVAVVLAAGIFAACGGSSSDMGGSSSSESPMPKGAIADDKEVLLGRTVYSSNCAACHGASGGGGVGPSFNGGKVLQSYPTAAGQEALIRQGRGGMPAYEGDLTDAQISAVVRYEREVLAKL
jgi:cytochrome c551